MVVIVSEDRQHGYQLKRKTDSILENLPEVDMDQIQKLLQGDFAPFCFFEMLQADWAPCSGEHPDSGVQSRAGDKKLTATKLHTRSLNHEGRKLADMVDWMCTV